ncbi:NUDIX hydrolase [Bosea sp. BH3]|uniref:NUDIX hydrolase n=1 Tax=Bosea sp. BH3 TaxID=2871701 RepID=UPI0021CB2180|nr:NUDIX domain-containing protein [Bosea sp. BH3]MCU4177947.1 NUDIX domain-containing protein [Bosea sp. BH3]
MDFLPRLAATVDHYRREVADRREHLSLLRWQIGQGHRLDSRDTFPGHLTTSAFVLSPDHAQVLLIDHIVIGRWLQPGGHWEEAEDFHQSAAREALEETGVQGMSLHPWHSSADIPFTIDSHDVPGKPARGEPDHVHHDLQYLFLADARQPLVAQVEEVHAAAWKPLGLLAEIAPRALARIATLKPPG